MKQTFEVEIFSLSVDMRYFSFDYCVNNGEIYKYQDSHVWSLNYKEFEKELSEGLAVKYALFDYVEHKMIW